MLSKQELKFCSDTLVVNALFGEPTIQKKAQDGGIISSVIQTVKNYVGNHIDSNDKVGSLLNIIAPGAISMFFGGKLGWLIGLAMNVFHIDVASILKSIYEEIKSILTSKKEISSQQVDQIVNNSVQEHSNIVEASSQTLRMMQLMMFSNPLIKEAQLFGDLFSSRRSKASSILSKVLSWIFKVAIASAGLMVAGDVINKFIGRPNAIDNTLQKGHPVDQVSVSLPTSTQSYFKINPSYSQQKYNVSAPWIEKIVNNKENIEDMLIDFAKDVYSGLDGLESNIRSTPGFQAISDKITWYNHSATNDNVVFIPKIFTSKKQMVDLFIDDVAAKVSPDKETKFASIGIKKNIINWKHS